MKKLDEWMDLYRMLYNLESYNIYTSNEFTENGKIMSGNKLRDFTLCKGKFKEDAENRSPEYINKISLINGQIPSAVLDNVHTHVTGNYKTCISNHHGKHEMLVMKKKTKIGMLKVTNKGWNYKDNKFSILPTKLGGTIGVKHIRDMTQLQHLIGGNCPTIIITKEHKKYYVAVSYSTKQVTNISKNIIAFDPGVRTFLTSADSTGEINELGKCMYDRIEKFIKRFKTRPCKTYNQRCAYKRSKAKIDRFIDDYHRKLAKYLSINYRAIIAPEIGNYLAKKSYFTAEEKLRQRMVRHANFSKRLRDACERYSCEYLYSNEHYTTKCCSQCSTGIYDIGRSKIYECPNGCQKIDRDVNSARNILSRFLSL